MSTRLALAPLVAVSLAVACGDTTLISVSSDGQLEVVIGSSGTGEDRDGFTISVDGGTSQAVLPGSRVTLTGLAPGSHSILLGGVAENCGVEGANPRTVTVGAAGTAEVAFAVHCERATTGALLVEVVTGGEPADTDGYLLVVGEGGVRHVASNAVERFEALPPGPHLVMLKGILAGCALEGHNPQPAVVEAGETAPLRLRVSCGRPTQ